MTVQISQRGKAYLETARTLLRAARLRGVYDAERSGKAARMEPDRAVVESRGGALVGSLVPR